MSLDIGHVLFSSEMLCGMRYHFWANSGVSESESRHCVMSCDPCCKEVLVQMGCQQMYLRAEQSCTMVEELDWTKYKIKQVVDMFHPFYMPQDIWHTRTEKKNSKPHLNCRGT